MKTQQGFAFELVCDGNTVADEHKACRCCPGECIGGAKNKEI